MIACFTNGPDALVFFAVVIEKPLVECQNIVFDGPGDVDGKLTAQFPKPILKNPPGPAFAFEIVEHIEAGLFLRKILRFH